VIHYQVFVNWSGSGFFHRFAKPGDAANLFGEAADNITSLKFAEIASISVFSSGFITKEITDYGLSKFIFEIPAGLGGAIQVGYDGVGYDIPAQPAGVYTAVCWLRAFNSNANSAQLEMALYRGTGTQVAVSSSFVVNLGNGWRQVAVTGTLASADRLFFRVRKAVSNPLEATYEMAGAMIIAGNSIPTGYNAGLITTYDNVSDYLQRGNWSQGFTRPHQFLAGMGRASITLKNDGGLFAPERTTSPLYGNLKPGRGVLVYGAADGGASTLMWSGFVESINVNPSGSLPQVVFMCHDRRRLADGKKIPLGVQTNVTARYLAELVEYSLALPVPDNAVQASPEPEAGTPEVYEEVYAYAPDATGGDSIDVVRTLADCAGAVLGKAWFQGRENGRFRFYQGHEIGGSVGALVLDGSRLQSANYQYGATIYNESVVVARRRKVSAATNKILYETEAAIALEANETVRINARYKDVALELDRTVSGLNVYLETVADAGVTVTLGTVTPNTAEIVIVNTLAAAKTVTSVKVRGKKLTAFGETEHRYVDTDSQAEYGTRAESLDFRLNSNMKRAALMAQHRVMVFGQPRGEFMTVTVREKLGDDALTTAMVSKTMGDPVRVQDEATGHDGYYVIVGEQHEFGSDAAPAVTWYLERQYNTFRLDDPVFGKLDGTNYLHWS
jgi:hypothetical protein